MDNGTIRQELERHGFAVGLPERVFQKLVENGQWVQHAAGEHFFCEGAKNDRLFFITAGKVSLEMHVPGRGRVSILTLGPGDVLAWSALLGREMTATAMAIDDVSAVAVSAGSLQQLCDQDHEFGYYVMRFMVETLAQRLLATRLQLLDLFADTEQARNSDVDSGPCAI